MIVCRQQPLWLAVLLAGILNCVGFEALANNVTLAWDPDSAWDVIGYNVYYGLASRTYTNSLNVGNTTTATIRGLVPGATYFFAVTAYDATGLESVDSPEISYTLPAVPTLQLRINPSLQAVLSGMGPVGYTYDVQASPDLKTWTRISSVTPDATGSFQFTDPNAIAGRRCYRLRQTSP